MGLGLLGTIDHATSLVFIGVAMTIVGVGVGASMQNLGAILAMRVGDLITGLGSHSGGRGGEGAPPRLTP